MRWLTRPPVAHRGLHGPGIPENSLAAVEAAVEEGYAVEVDVRLSADGVPVLFHDERLERVADARGPLEERTWYELSELSLEETGEAIPSLEEGLAAIDGEVPLLVELKNWGEPGRLERRTADVLDDYGGRFAIQSFNPRSLAWFRRERPEWTRGQIAGWFEGVELAAYKRVLLKRLAVTWLSRPDYVAYEHHRLPYWPVSLHRSLGMPVLAWTVCTPDEVERVLEHADNVIFEGFRP